MSSERKKVGLFVSDKTRRNTPIVLRLSTSDLRKAVEVGKAIPGQVSASDPSVTQPRVSNPQAEVHKTNAAGHYMLADHFSRMPGPEAKARVKYHNDQFHAHIKAGHTPEARHFQRARYQLPSRVASALGKSNALYIKL